MDIDDCVVELAIKRRSGDAEMIKRAGEEMNMVTEARGAAAREMIIPKQEEVVDGDDDGG